MEGILVTEDSATTGIDESRGSMLPVALYVNGERHSLTAPAHRTLLEVLREDLRLTGTKHGCDLGECGACAVLIDGETQLACLTLAVECADRCITTVEGLADGPRLHPLQTAFVELGAAQCGYCTSGFLMSARALLEHNPAPTRDEIKDALSGNLCRCTGYLKIIEAVERAAAQLRQADDTGAAAERITADGTTTEGAPA